MSFDVGPNNPTVATQNDLYSTGVLWTNPGDAISGNDGTPATISLAPSTFASAFIFFTGFNFSVPAGSYLLSALIEIRCKVDVADGGYSTVINGSGWLGGPATTNGSISYQNLPDTFTWLPATNGFLWVGGVPTTNLETADINSSGFGFGIQAINTTGSARVISVSNARLTLTYVTEVDPSEAGDIRNGTSVGGVTGTLVVPLQTDVRSGTQYGAAGTQYTGNATFPAEADVKQGVQYGANGTQYTGTLVAGLLIAVSAAFLIRIGFGANWLLGATAFLNP